VARLAEHPEAEKDRERQAHEGQRDRENDGARRTEKLHGGHEGVGGAPGRGERLEPEQYSGTLQQPGRAPPANQRYTPLEHWRKIHHDRCAGDHAGHDGGWGRNGIEQVIEPGDVVGSDLEQRRGAEGDRGRYCPDPGKTVRERDVAGQRTKADREERYEYPEAARSRQPQSQSNAEQRIDRTHQSQATRR
jgi:hypothetical protein